MKRESNNPHVGYVVSSPLFSHCMGILFIKEYYMKHTWTEIIVGGIVGVVMIILGLFTIKWILIDPIIKILIIISEKL